MSPFLLRYQHRVLATQSVQCVGIDLDFTHVPMKKFGSGLGAMERYAAGVLELAAPRAPYVKFQEAYYQAPGDDDYVAMLIRLIEYGHYLGLEVGLDGKKNEIDRSMEKWGEEVFGRFKVDFCTVTPYLGNTYKAWLKWLKEGRAAISMILTSNPEALLQQQELKNGLLVYEQQAIWTREWNDEMAQLTEGAGAIGGVIGATKPGQAARARELAGDAVFILSPGYGAGQGGGADGAVEAIITSAGGVNGIVNNSSGSTKWSWLDKGTKQPKPGDSMAYVQETIEATNCDLNAALERKLGKSVQEIYAVGPVNLPSDFYSAANDALRNMGEESQF